MCSRGLSRSPPIWMSAGTTAAQAGGQVCREVRALAREGVTAARPLVRSASALLFSTYCSSAHPIVPLAAFPFHALFFWPHPRALRAYTPPPSIRGGAELVRARLARGCASIAFARGCANGIELRRLQTPAHPGAAQDPNIYHDLPDARVMSLPASARRTPSVPHRVHGDSTTAARERGDPDNPWSQVYLWQNIRVGGPQESHRPAAGRERACGGW
ncbi:hypothetical protein FB451DRAFT_151271 [Mycena latifolia]|nr:hypothetical protein FB451DRAFT_151271 [Mycena latifolia]